MLRKDFIEVFTFPVPVKEKNNPMVSQGDIITKSIEILAIVQGNDIPHKAKTPQSRGIFFPFDDNRYLLVNVLQVFKYFSQAYSSLCIADGRHIFLSVQ